MLRRRARFALQVTAIVSLMVCAAAADSRARIVRLSYLEGDVRIDRGDGRGLERAILNTPVVYGDRLNTSGNASAEVEFEAGSTVRLTPDTSVLFRELSLRGTGERLSVLELEEGAAYFDVDKKEGDFIVTVRGQEFSVGKSARFRMILDRDQLRVAVFKGDLDARAGYRDVEIRKNETFTLDLSDPGRHYLAKGIDEDPYDDWDRDRERYRERYLESSYRGYSSAYRWGVSDLHYYGSYYDLPGYGWVWRPFGVPTHWHPFMDGAWLWRPGWGYIWVSSYPWGWTPYRYGHWTFIGGHGWCWRPGHSWGAWRPYTTVYNPPSGYVQPAPPATPGPVVIPVGSGPNLNPRNTGLPGWMRYGSENDPPVRPGRRGGTGSAGVAANPATPGMVVAPAPTAPGTSAGGAVPTGKRTVIDPRGEMDSEMTRGGRRYGGDRPATGGTPPASVVRQERSQPAIAPQKGIDREPAVRPSPPPRPVPAPAVRPAAPPQRSSSPPSRPSSPPSHKPNPKVSN